MCALLQAHEGYAWGCVAGVWLQADVVLVMDQDRLYTQLTDRLKVGRLQLSSGLGQLADIIQQHALQGLCLPSSVALIWVTGVYGPLRSQGGLVPGATVAAPWHRPFSAAV